MPIVPVVMLPVPVPVHAAAVTAPMRVQRQVARPLQRMPQLQLRLQQVLRPDKADKPVRVREQDRVAGKVVEAAAMVEAAA